MIPTLRRGSSRSTSSNLEAAEFRGPGVHHRVDDSPDDIDMDLDHRFRPNSGLGGRIILLGDGTEISADTADSDMFDHDDEDKDLDSQVSKYPRDGKPEGSNGEADAARNAREQTPGPTQTNTEQSSDNGAKQSDIQEKVTSPTELSKSPEPVN